MPISYNRFSYERAGRTASSGSIAAMADTQWCRKSSEHAASSLSRPVQCVVLTSATIHATNSSTVNKRRGLQYNKRPDMAHTTTEAREKRPTIKGLDIKCA